MQDRAILRTLWPSRLGVVALAEFVEDFGYPGGHGWWRQPTRSFVESAQHELDQLASGDISADHLVRATLLLLEALHQRSQGK